MLLASPEVHSTCPYCGVGCGVLARAGGAEIVGDPKHPANHGRLCSKGMNLVETLGEDGRLRYPSIEGRKVSWDVAIEHVASGLRAIIEKHGPDSVGFYVSGQLLTEDYYVANKLMKGFIGSANIDANSRLCMASAVAAYKRSLGSDTVPNSYRDIDHADLVVMVGSNAAWCHPVLFRRVIDDRESAGRRLVVIDPRRTTSADEADLHLPIRAGTDTTLFNGLLHHLRMNGRLDFAFLENHCSGLSETLTAAAESASSVEHVARVCGLSEEKVLRFFSMFLESNRTVSLFSMGVNQAVDGSDKANAIINCHLATGRIAKRGCGPFSLTGQPNAMGGREVGALANLLAAHMDFSQPDDIDRVQCFWDAPRMASRPGLRAVEMFDALAEGRLKAVWIMATNPAASLPNSDRVRQALASAELSIVSDCYVDTDTVRLSQVHLPALPWGEKDGTVTNSERRISRQKAFLSPLDEARADWWIICRVARAMGFEHGFEFSHPAEIFDEHARLSAYENDGRRSFDLSGMVGLSRAEYDTLKPVPWPVRGGDTKNAERPFSGGQFDTDDGRARLIPIRVRPKEENRRSYPLRLNTGRIRDQWHTMTRTGRSATLSAHISEPYAEMHPDTAAQYGIEHGGLVRVKSEHGSVTVRAHVSSHQMLNAVFVPMHWTAVLSSNGRVNAAVHAQVDPVSAQPDLKATPVYIEPVDVAWYGFVITRRELDLNHFAYWVRVQGDGVLRYEIAGGQTPDDFARWARSWLCDEQTGSEWIEYLDARQGRYRALRVVDDALESCVFIAPSTKLPSREWLTAQFHKKEVDPLERHNILAGRPNAGDISDETMICACHKVSLGAVLDVIHRHGVTRTEEISERLGAGSGCGSCVPEIRELLQLHRSE